MNEERRRLFRSPKGKLEEDKAIADTVRASTRGGARGEQRWLQLSRRGTLAPPSGKLNNSSWNDIRGGNFKYSCLFCQTGIRKNKLSALNVNNKSKEESFRENRGE